MARPLRIEFPGAFYQVTSRGDRREPIFEDGVDRLAFLDVLGSGLERFDGCALAWCFMGNHDHFVFQTRQPNLSLPMRHINGVYTQRFNQRHRTWRRRWAARMPIGWRRAKMWHFGPTTCASRCTWATRLSFCACRRWL